VLKTRVYRRVFWIRKKKTSCFGTRHFTIRYKSPLDKSVSSLWKLFYTQNHVWKNYLCVWEAVLVRHNYSFVLVSCALYWMFTKGNYVHATMQPGIVQTTAGHLQDSHPIIHLCMPYFYGWTTWTASAYIQERSPRRHGPVEFLVLSSETDANETDARSLSSTDMTASRSSASRIMKMRSATGIWVPECFRRETEPHFVTFIHIPGYKG